MLESSPEVSDRCDRDAGKGDGRGTGNGARRRLEQGLAALEPGNVLRYSMSLPTAGAASGFDEYICVCVLCVCVWVVCGLCVGFVWVVCGLCVGCVCVCVCVCACTHHIHTHSTGRCKGV